MSNDNATPTTATTPAMMSTLHAATNVKEKKVKTKTAKTSKEKVTKAAPVKGENAHARIKDLIKELESTKDQIAKKGIRAKLRRLGHYGGVRVEKLIVTKAEAAKILKS